MWNIILTSNTNIHNRE